MRERLNIQHTNISRWIAVGFDQKNVGKIQFQRSPPPGYQELKNRESIYDISMLRILISSYGRSSLLTVCEDEISIEIDHTWTIFFWDQWTGWWRHWESFRKSCCKFHQMHGPTFGVAYLLDHVCAASDPPKDRVLVVKPSSRCKGYEELTAVGVGSGIGHWHLRRYIGKPCNECRTIIWNSHGEMTNRTYSPCKVHCVAVPHAARPRTLLPKCSRLPFRHPEGLPAEFMGSSYRRCMHVLNRTIFLFGHISSSHRVTTSVSLHLPSESWTLWWHGGTRRCRNTRYGCGHCTAKYAPIKIRKPRARAEHRVVPEIFDCTRAVFTEEVYVDVSVVGSDYSALAQDRIPWS